MKVKQKILEILKKEIYPALGCTEPAALAYAGALVSKELRGEIKAINVTVDKNLYKNCLRVTIPKTNLKGISYAVALGVVGGNYAYKLEALRDLNKAQVDTAVDLVNKGLINVNIRKEVGFYIDIFVKADNTAHCRIENNHNNVTLLKYNNKTLIKEVCSPSKKIEENSILNIKVILDFIRSVDVRELDFLEEMWKINLGMARSSQRICREGFLRATVLNNHRSGSIKDLACSAKILTALACDARMNGVDQAIIAVAGSGNQGITASIPVVMASEAKKISKEKTLRALALSALITICIKHKIGILSPVCGCAVAAGAGVTAALTYIMGGTDREICGAINGLISSLAGIACDGAKRGCAFKIASTVGSAFDIAYLSLNGVAVKPLDGIVAKSVDKTIDNLAYLSKEGMKCFDDALIKIMMDHEY